MSMLRQSIASFSRAASRAYPAASSSSPAFAASSSSSLHFLRRHYSETAESSPGSEGAEAASSAVPGQQADAAKPDAAGKEAKASPAESETAKKLEKYEKDNKDLKDRVLRSMADFENLQKITTREKKNAKDYAIEKFAKDIISNMDILQLALNSVPKERRTAQASPPASETEGASNGRDYLVELYEGVSMTARELEKTLGRFDVRSFDPTGQKFDPNLHEAMYQAPVPGKEPGSVLDCQKIGWKLKDRVLRAAQVGIVMDAK